jgi:hypothetical protein
MTKNDALRCGWKGLSPKVPTQHLSGGTGENHKKSVRITWHQVENQIQGFPKYEVGMATI